MKKSMVVTPACVGVYNVTKMASLEISRLSLVAARPNQNLKYGCDIEASPIHLWEVLIFLYLLQCYVFPYTHQAVICPDTNNIYHLSSTTLSRQDTTFALLE
jgi:hypothetical protein